MSIEAEDIDFEVEVLCLLRSIESLLKINNAHNALMTEEELTIEDTE